MEQTVINPQTTLTDEQFALVMARGLDNITRYGWNHGEPMADGIDIASALEGEDADEHHIATADVALVWLMVDHFGWGDDAAKARAGAAQADVMRFLSTTTITKRAVEARFGPRWRQVGELFENTTELVVSRWRQAVDTFDAECPDIIGTMTWADELIDDIGMRDAFEQVEDALAAWVCGLLDYFTGHEWPEYEMTALLACAVMAAMVPQLSDADRAALIAPWKSAFPTTWDDSIGTRGKAPYTGA